MTPTPEQSVDQHRQRLARRALCWVACLIPIFAVVDGLALGAFPTRALAVRIVWGAVVIGIALRLPVLERAHFRRLVRILAGTSALALALIVHFTGGSETMLFSVLPTLPLAVVVLTQDDGAAAWVVSVIVAASMIAMLLAEGATPSHLGAWAVFAVGMSSLSILGAGLYRRREAMVVALERERLAAVEKAAELERRRAEWERQRAEADRLVLLGELSAGVAHEINNPLAFVKSNLAFALTDSHASEFDGEVREALQEALSGIARIEGIVCDMRNFARVDCSTKEPFEVGGLVDEALRFASVRLKAVGQVTCDVAPTLPGVRSERGRLLQVLVNLLVNAADAIEDRPRAGSWVGVRAVADGDAVQLTVEDNGPGLPEAVLRRAFEAFFTTKPAGKGTGLGLAISRRSVERLGGTLTAGNRPEGGAIFTLRIPTLHADQEAPQLPEPAEGATPSRTGAAVWSQASAARLNDGPLVATRFASGQT